MGQWLGRIIVRTARHFRPFVTPGLVPDEALWLQVLLPRTAGGRRRRVVARRAGGLRAGAVRRRLRLLARDALRRLRQ